MLIIFFRVLSIFLILGIGFFCSKKGYLPKESSKYLGFIVVSITHPSLIFSSLANLEVTSDTTKPIVEIIIVSAIYILVFTLISFFLLSFDKKNIGKDFGLLVVMTTSSNNGFMGIPVVKTVFGDKYLYLIVIASAIFSIYHYAISLFVMNIGYEKKKISFVELIRPFFTPIIISTVLGFAVMFFRITLPSTVLNFFDILGSATSALSLIVLGIQLANSDFLNIKNKFILFKTSVMTLIIFPLITLSLIHMLPISNQVKIATLLSSAFPCAVIVSTIAEREGKNHQLASQGISLSTLLSIITLPIWIMLLSLLYY